VAIKEYEGTPGRPGRKGYWTRVATGEDIKKQRGTLDKQAREMKGRKDAKALRENVHPVRNFAGSTRHVSEKSLERILAIQRTNKKLYPKGPPSSRITVSMGARIADGRVIRDGEE
jgi:hypothetical protein